MYTMIIADDEVIARKSLELFIKKEFPAVEIVSSCENGVDFIHKCEELAPDMAIVDINMPGITGVHAIEMLKNKNVNTKFIINTAYDEFEYVKKALDMKVDAYLLKPQKYEESKKSIQKVCEDIDKEKAEHEKRDKWKSLIHAVSPVLENEIMLSIHTNKFYTEGLEMFCRVKEISCRGGCVLTMVNGGAEEAEEEMTRRAIAQTLDGVCDHLINMKKGNIVILLLVPVTVEKTEEEIWLGEIERLLFTAMKKLLGISYRIGCGKVYDLFEQLPLSYEDSAGMLKENRRLSVYVQRAVHYIDKNYPQDISLDNAAAYAKISPYYLSHLMKQEFGKSFVEYLTDVRMQQAMRLAKETALPIRMIAEKCGYVNETYFCKVFKAQIGTTIGTYRRSIRYEEKEKKEET